LIEWIKELLNAAEQAELDKTITGIIVLGIVIILASNIKIEFSKGQFKLYASNKERSEKINFAIAVFIIIAAIAMLLAVLNWQALSSKGQVSIPAADSGSPADNTYISTSNKDLFHTSSLTGNSGSVSNQYNSVPASEKNYIGMVNADSIYIRKQPRREKNNVVRRIAYAGTAVNVLGQLTVNNLKWYKVSYDGVTGYVVAQFIDLPAGANPPQTYYTE